MKIVILAGGNGTRLWPLSRRNYPKQFLHLFRGRSLLQVTAERFLRGVEREDILVITNKDHEFHVRTDLPWVKHIIPEPVGRNTAPAIALAAQYAIERMGCGKDETIFVSPSDHLIEPTHRFLEYLKVSDRIAHTGRLVTLGIKPTRPETGYGYIKADFQRPLDCGLGDGYEVDDFVEKPDLEAAEWYVTKGNYFWNSGMFAFTPEAIEKELIKHAQDIAAKMALGYNAMIADFAVMPSISIDYAVMEKSSKAAIIPADLHWNDVGSWDSVFDNLGADEVGSITANVVEVDSKGTVVVGDKRLIATIGLDNCVIVDTPDALLIARKGCAQKVKTITDHLVAVGRREAFEHTTTHRPWGSFTTILEADGYKVKHITVQPGGTLSLQLHHRRSEHWTIVKGKAEVTLGDRIETVTVNEAIHIPVTMQHRLENRQITPLELIEVQYGDYLGEDDIVRLEDEYGRACSDQPV